MKSLIITAHPNLGESVINKHWLEELRKHPDLCTILVLSEHYPDGQIDIEISVDTTRNFLKNREQRDAAENYSLHEIMKSVNGGGYDED